MIKSHELGVISVDAGDVICFSMDEVLRMAERQHMDVDDFISQHKGVECDFRSDGGYGVDKVIAVQQDGTTFDMVLIGGDVKNLRRFLLEEEPNFEEFVEALVGVLREVQVSEPAHEQLRQLYNKHQRDGKGLGPEEFEALLFRLLSFMRLG